MLLTEKYAPASLDDIIGNEEALQEIKKWALEFERGKTQKPLLLHGPPGTGKTAAARALAKQFSWTLVETNTSDIRNPDNLKKMLGSGGKGLFGENRLLLLDEIDGAFDRGEVPELVKIIKENDQPIILTANDLWNKHLANLRTLCRPLEFKKVNARSITELLMRVEKEENLLLTKEQIQLIAKASAGDVRAAIIDLQTDGGIRDREANVFQSLRTLFKTTSYGDATRVSDNLDIELDTFIKWIEENIPLEYETKEEKATAFEWLSKTDKMQARIKRRQYYGLLRYVKAFSHAGVSLSKQGVYRKFTPYQFPSLLRTLSASKSKRALFYSICQVLANELHCSTSKIAECFPYLAMLPIETIKGLNEEQNEFIEEMRSRNKFKPDKEQQSKHKK